MSDVERNMLLLERIGRGEEGALEALTEENMGLVKSVALRFKGRGTEYEDLVQIGAIGMIKAAKSFDFSYGTAFSTYAVPLIAGEIRRHLRDDGPIKVSRTVKKLGSDAMKAREQFLAKEGREPRLSELAALCGVDREQLAGALEAVSPVRSIYEGVGKDEEGQLLDLLPDSSDELERLTDRLALRQALSCLSGLHRQIVILRYYKELSQEQTGRILGLSQVKVSREEKKIMAILREFL
ncbi:MAG: sigma-70 family RNA polymerase sigma factor [Clostridia bacterium]|nr:sigma-70 family RNA polymerase sigma factor [Clostridia bacterium]